MREMKDSGIQWIGKIPKDYQIIKLKYLLSQNDGGLWGEDPQGNINDKVVLRSTEQTIDGKWIILDPAIRCLGNGSNLRYYTIKNNDLLVTKSSGSPLHIGKTTLANSDLASKNYYYSNFLQRLHTKNALDTKFLWYIMNSPYSREQFVYMQNSTSGIGNINSENINDLIIALPNKNEQDLIVQFLNKKCAEIDGITKDLQEQIDTLENYKKSVITEAVTKGLKPNVEMKSSPIAWAKNIPSHWKHMPNKYIMTKIKKICPVHNDEDIISLSMNGVVVRDLDAGGKMPATFNGYQFVYPGNLLMCLFDYDVTPRCIGYIKNYGLTSPAYSQFKMNRNNFAKYYYYYYLMIDNTKELLHLAKNLRHSFTEDELGKIYAIVPPIQEQKEIANYLDNKCAEIDEIIKSKKEQVEIIEEYKKSLIYEYVTGKKEVKTA